MKTRLCLFKARACHCGIGKIPQGLVDVIVEGEVSINLVEVNSRTEDVVIKLGVVCISSEKLLYIWGRIYNETCYRNLDRGNSRIRVVAVNHER